MIEATERGATRPERLNTMRNKTYVRAAATPLTNSKIAFIVCH